MDISVIIVNWNAKQLLIECIDSVIKDFGDLEVEVIVVDNDSTDDSVQSVRDTFKSVIVIENSENLGFSKANNIGIKQSSGKYICLINSDIIVKKGCLKNMFEYMERNISIGMLGPKLLNTDESIQTSCKKFPTIWNNITRTFFLHKLFPKSSFFSSEEMNYFLHDRIKQVEALAGAFLMVRRKAISKIGLLDEAYFFYSEDIDWCKRFWEKGWKVVFFPKAVCIHHDGGSSKKTPVAFHLRLIQSKFIYMKKHHNTIIVNVFRFVILNQYIIRVLLSILSSLFNIEANTPNTNRLKYLKTITYVLRPNNNKL